VLPQHEEELAVEKEFRNLQCFFYRIILTRVLSPYTCTGVSTTVCAENVKIIIHIYNANEKAAIPSAMN